MGGVREEVLVPTLTLDRLYQELPPPDFIKIDVKGAEMMVVSGVQSLFEIHNPMVYIEVSQAVADQIISFFGKLGYRSFNERADALDDSGTAQTSNLFFAHQGHKDRVQRLKSSLNKKGAP